MRRFELLLCVRMSDIHTVRRKVYQIGSLKTRGNIAASRDLSPRYVCFKPGFHYPSWRPELIGDGFHYPSTRARVSTSRVDGPSTRLVETHARQHGPCWRVMETGHPSTRVVETGLWSNLLVSIDHVKVEIFTAPHHEKLTTEELNYGSHSCYTVNTPYLPLPRKRSPDGATTECSNSSHMIAAYHSFIDSERMKGWVGL